MGAYHYSYNLLKIRRPSGVIAIHGSIELGVQCNKQSIDLGTRIIDLDPRDASPTPREEPSASKV